MRPIALALLVTLTASLSSCAHSPPIVAPVESCGGKLVTADNLTRIEKDWANFDAGGEADLVLWAGTDGWQFVACIVDWYIKNGTEAQKAAAARFKAGHVEARVSLWRSSNRGYWAAAPRRAPPGEGGPGLVGGGG